MAHYRPFCHMKPVIPPLPRGTIIYQSGMGPVILPGPSAIQILQGFANATERNLPSIAASIEQAIRNGVALKAPTRTRRVRPTPSP